MRTLKEKNLKSILSLKYLENDNITFIETKKLISTPFEKELINVLELLAGRKELPETRINGYFFESRKFALEYDDQLSYNRYRLKTFRSDIYQNFPGIKLDKVRNYCNKYEKECLKSGSAPGLWTNPEAENLFGKAEQPGDFGLNGASGWKLRAYQDFLKDIYSRFSKVRLLRISCWDEILINKQLHKIGDLLNNPSEKTAEHILKFIERRVINLYID